MKSEPSLLQLFVLPTQEDIALFKQGAKPENCIHHTFNTQGEVDAYKLAHEVLESECEEVNSLCVYGSKVTYNILSDDDDEVCDLVEVNFSTPQEAAAFKVGVEDSDGFIGALILEMGNDGFDRLAQYQADGELSDGREASKALF